MRCITALRDYKTDEEDLHQLGGDAACDLLEQNTPTTPNDYCPTPRTSQVYDSDKNK